MTVPPVERTEVAGQREPLPVELYRPEGSGPFPAVVVICEAWGLNADIRRIAGRFAQQGYLAAAPDLYRGRHFLRCVGSAMRALQAGRGAEVSDLQAVVAAVAEQPDVRSVGVVGFCMGGGYALLLGSASEVGAVGDYYGAVSPAVDFASMCPVFARYGKADVALRRFRGQLEHALVEHEVPHDVAMVDGVGHSFMNQSGSPVLTALTWPLLRVGYAEAAAERAWTDMLGFFGQHL